jgi:uncharacterized membrane protein
MGEGNHQVSTSFQSTCIPILTVNILSCIGVIAFQTLISSEMDRNAQYGILHKVIELSVKSRD